MVVRFDWNQEKNEELIRQRGVSFESIVAAIEQGGLVDVVEHPNRERYPGQFIYIVELHGYLHLVPYIAQEDDARFLKTIIPSRKATRDYRGRRPT